MMPLTLTAPRVELKIVKLCGLDKTQCRLQDMEFVPGSIVELICINNGNVICKIKDTRIAIDRDLAMRIMV